MKHTRILLATDFSAASGPAARQALEMARGEGKSLLIAHALEPPVPFSPDGYVLPRIYDEMALAQRQEAQRQMQRLLARARKAGVQARGVLLRGAAHDAIVRAARRHRAGRLIVGTHGRSGFSRLFLGSVAARVVSASPCPVLVVPAAGTRRSA